MEHHEAAAQGHDRIWNPTGPAAAAEEGRSAGHNRCELAVTAPAGRSGPSGTQRSQPGRSYIVCIMCILHERL